MRSKVFQRILDKWEKRPWYKKLHTWIVVEYWTRKCLTRKYWDKSFSGYIFKKKNEHKN